MSYYTPQPLPDTHDPKEKSRLAWACGGLTFGIIMTIGSVAQTSAKDVVGSATFGLALLIPSIWWLYCNNKDKQALAQIRRERDTHAYLSSVLSPEDAPVKRGMGAPPQYEPMQRHWIIVIAISAILFGTGTALGSSTTNAPDSSPSGRSGVEEYATCEEAWKEGQQNIPEDNENYDIHLDEDKDGIACEK